MSRKIGNPVMMRISRAEEYAVGHARNGFIGRVKLGKARGAIALVLTRPAIRSLIVDNLNASIHLRALLTDLFLIDQALKS